MRFKLALLVAAAAMAVLEELEETAKLMHMISPPPVALSEAQDEFEEALLKGRALARAVAASLGRTLAADDPFATLIEIVINDRLRTILWPIPTDGDDAASLIAHADEGVFAARAAGVSLA